ncbi:MAG TPA: hypothetical protein PKX64_04440 [Elusimicrobiota bacterium]|nr:hypothetical protein [Elusimicrobiota bacterium]
MRPDDSPFGHRSLAQQGRPSRAWALALGAVLLLSVPAREAPMPETLAMHPLDEGLFPEREKDPVVYVIEASIVRPEADPRLVLPAGCSAAVLVSSTLLAEGVPPGASWNLEVRSKTRRQTFRLESPVPRGGNVLPIDPVPGPRPKGTVDRALFWVDLTPLALAPGDLIVLVHGPAKTELPFPR